MFYTRHIIQYIWLNSLMKTIVTLINIVGMLGSEMYLIHNLCTFKKKSNTGIYQSQNINLYYCLHKILRGLYLSSEMDSVMEEKQLVKWQCLVDIISSHFQPSFRDFSNYCYWEFLAVTKICMRLQNDLSFEEEMQIIKYSGSIFPCQPSERVIIRAGFTL